MKISFTKKQYLGFASVLLMLVIWQLLAMYFNSDFIILQIVLYLKKTKIMYSQIEDLR